MLKNVLAAIFFILLVFAIMQVRSLLGEKANISAQFNAAKIEFDKANNERGRLQADLQYLSIPENLDKELRAEFHYQAPGEKVLILVPRGNSTGTASTSPR